MEEVVVINPVDTARLVTREVRTGFRDNAPTKIVVAVRTYPTDQDDLWDALTNPERIPRWFLPITGELSVGGRYQFDGNAGGVIELCDEPNSFAVTWEMGPMVSWLTITLTAADDGTTLELVHEAPVDPSMWEQYGPGAVGVGWDLSLMGLGLHLDTKAAVDPTEGLAFPTTPIGIEFVQLAATDWAEAAVRDGDETAAAHRSAARTFAFYTGTTEDSAST
jgi:uncharacterized protein YndB with AHSA1/START domain